MKKLRRDLRIGLAGACCGLFAASVFLLAERVNNYYSYLSWREANGYRATYDRGVEDLWWVPIAVWHVVLSIVASLSMHRYLPNHRVSPFLRWQAIGLVALGGWGLTLFLGIALDCLVRGNLSPLAQVWTSIRPISIAQFVAAVFASNVLYGSAIQAAAGPQRSAIDPAVPPQELL